MERNAKHKMTFCGFCCVWMFDEAKQWWNIYNQSLMLINSEIFVIIAKKSLLSVENLTTAKYGDERSES